MHPEIAKTFVEQRRQELTRLTAESRQIHQAGSGWLSRHLPRWHVSWTRTVLSPAGGPGAAGSGYPDRPGKRGSSLVIIISAYR
jgi:hypothetical protein